MTDINLDKIKKIDRSGVYNSVISLPDQCLHAFEEASKVVVPDTYKSIDNVVMAGMGGSGLAARAIESLYKEEFKIPLVRVNDYRLPGFVNEKTLVILSSYSGGTEEVIASAEQAISRGAKWLAIGTGGELLELAQKKGVPFYKIVPQYNPSNQPRMAIGYSVVGQMVLAAKAGLFAFEKKDLLNAISSMREVIKENSASTLASKLLNKIPIFVASQHLIGALHTVNNQINENAKSFSADFEIPEINHHLLEGLKHHGLEKDNLIFVFVDSKFYPDLIKKRFKLTQEVVQKQKIDTWTYSPTSATELGEAFELIQFGAFVALYLAILYDQDPSPIPWVDYFKEKLAKE